MYKYIVYVLLVLSLIANGYLFIKKGVTLQEDRSVHNYVNSWNGQIMINQFLTQGDSVVWLYKPMSDFKSIDELCTFKNSLHPTSSWFAQKETITSIKFKVWERSVDYITYPIVTNKSK